NPTPSFGGDVTVTVTGSSGSGTLGGTTTVAASGGVASFSGLVLDTAGTDTLQVSSTGFSPVATGRITGTPAAASPLVLTTPPPSIVTAGAGFGLQVEAEDPYGNLATGFDGGVTAALSANSGNAAIGGTVTAVASQGIASFSSLVVDNAGGGYTIHGTRGGLAGATSTAL